MEIFSIKTWLKTIRRPLGSTFKVLGVQIAKDQRLEKKRLFVATKSPEVKGTRVMSHSRGHMVSTALTPTQEAEPIGSGSPSSESDWQTRSNYVAGEVAMMGVLSFTNERHSREPRHTEQEMLGKCKATPVGYGDMWVILTMPATCPWTSQHS